MFNSEAISTACYLLKRVVTKQEETSIPFEKFFSRKPEIKHLRVFGIDAYLKHQKKSVANLTRSSSMLVTKVNPAIIAFGTKKRGSYLSAVRLISTGKDLKNKHKMQRMFIVTPLILA